MSQQMPSFPVQTPNPPPPAKRRSGVLTAVLALALILAVLLLLNASLFKVTFDSVSVPGFTEEQKRFILDKAGLSGPVSYFALNEEKIAQGIESDRYLVFEGMEKSLPNRVTLSVRVRKAAAWVQEMGAYYYLADDGMVLERKTKEQFAQDRNSVEGLIAVTGLQPKELREGRIMTAKNADRLNAYLKLMEEMTKQTFLSEVSELNLTDVENITLVTTDPYTVRLGDVSDMRAKIGTVRAVVKELREMGKEKGTLVASTPGQVIYSPPVN